MRKYKVVGTQPIMEHQPGETFTAKIPKDQEAFLIGIGGLEVVKKAPKVKASPATTSQ